MNSQSKNKAQSKTKHSQHKSHHTSMPRADSHRQHAFKKQSRKHKVSDKHKPHHSPHRSKKSYHKIQDKIAHKLASQAKHPKEQSDSQTFKELERYKKELHQCQTERDQYKNNLLYLKAEFENYKKRTLSEKANFLKYACEPLAIEVLDVVDTLEKVLSFKIDSQNIQSFSDGIKMVHSAFIDALKKHNVIAVSVLGQHFNPHLCDALSKEPSDKVPPEHISQVIKKPYKMHDKVIRFGQVIVAQANPESKTAQESLSSEEKTETIIPSP